MKLKPAVRKLLIKILAILALALIVLAAVFLIKSRFIKTAPDSQSNTSPESSQLPPLPDQKFAPRDPNLNNEQNLVKDYLANHLTELSPTKEVLGGKFYLTDIKFNGANQADISYEDGHIALQAQVSYTINPRELKITDFKITKEN